MEQYWMPKKLDFFNLRLCLDNYPQDALFIRDCGGMDSAGKYRAQGLAIVNEKLEDKVLDFKRENGKVQFLINDHEVFCFRSAGPSDEKGFSLAYERIEAPSKEAPYGRMVVLSHGENPDDPVLPEPQQSFLRAVWDGHLLEIYFKGKIPLKFHSWWQEPHWKYWTVDMRK